MHELLNNAGFVALMGTLFGGAGLKLIEAQLGKAKARAADAAGIREELRKQIEDLRGELARSQAEETRLEGLVEEYKDRYWSYREQTQKEISALNNELERWRRGGNNPPPA